MCCADTLEIPLEFTPTRHYDAYHVCWLVIWRTSVQRLLCEVTVIVWSAERRKCRGNSIFSLQQETHHRRRLVGAAEIAVRKVAQRHERGAGGSRRWWERWSVARSSRRGASVRRQKRWRGSRITGLRPSRAANARNTRPAGSARHYVAHRRPRLT